MGTRAPVSGESQGDIPSGQRLFDNVFLLLLLGIVIMVAFYTGWGVWEVMKLAPAPLP